MAIARVFIIKSGYGLSEASYDSIIKWAKSMLPKGVRLTQSFYIVKSMMKPLNLGYTIKLICIQTFTYYTIVNMQILPRAKSINMLSINQ